MCPVWTSGILGFCLGTRRRGRRLVMSGGCFGRSFCGLLRPLAFTSPIRMWGSLPYLRRIRSTMPSRVRWESGRSAVCWYMLIMWTLCPNFVIVSSHRILPCPASWLVLLPQRQFLCFDFVRSKWSAFRQVRDACLLDPPHVLVSPLGAQVRVLVFVKAL